MASQRCDLCRSPVCPKFAIKISFRYYDELDEPLGRPTFPSYLTFHRDTPAWNLSLKLFAQTRVDVLLLKGDATVMKTHRKLNGNSTVVVRFIAAENWKARESPHGFQHESSRWSRLLRNFSIWKFNFHLKGFTIVLPKVLDYLIFPGKHYKSRQFYAQIGSIVKLCLFTVMQKSLIMNAESELSRTFPSTVPVKFIKLKTLLTLRIRNGESLNKQKSRFFSLKIASSSEAPLWLFCVLLVDENSSQFSIKLLRPNFWKIHRCVKTGWVKWD